MRRIGMTAARRLAVLGGGFRLPYSVDFSALADGALPSRFNGATWTISSGAAVNAPTLGTEELTNGGFDSDTTGWTAVNATLTSEALIGSTGNGLKAINTTTAAGYAYQGITSVTDGWYWLRLSHQNFNAIQGVLRIGTASDGTQIYSPAAYVDTYGNGFVARTVTFRAPGTSVFVRLVNNSITATQGTLWDTVILKRVTLASAMALVFTSANNVSVKAGWTITAGTQAGVVARADSAISPLNFLLAYHDGTNAQLWKCVNGTFTSLISTAVAYSAGANVEIRCSGTTVQLFYNDAQVSTDKAVDEATINTNRLHGLFDPSGVNGCGSMVLANFP